MAIIDVEIGGPLSGGQRCVVSHEGREVVLYLGHVTLAKVADEAADALLLRRGPYFLVVNGEPVDGRHTLDGDLVAELGVGWDR